MIRSSVQDFCNESEIYNQLTVQLSKSVDDLAILLLWSFLNSYDLIRSV